MGNVISLNKYKENKRNQENSDYFAELQEEYNYALKYGVCDLCGIPAADVRKFDAVWCCDGCVSELEEKA